MTHYPTFIFAASQFFSNAPLMSQRTWFSHPSLQCLLSIKPQSRTENYSSAWQQPPGGDWIRTKCPLHQWALLAILLSHQYLRTYTYLHNSHWRNASWPNARPSWASLLCHLHICTHIQHTYMQSKEESYVWVSYRQHGGHHTTGVQRQLHGGQGTTLT